MVTQWARLVPSAVLLLGLMTTCTTPQPGAAAAQRGAGLYQRHCAGCHGGDGTADTVIAGLLTPRPRAFDSGLFHLVSTRSGLPRRADLVRTLQRGMPGSVMLAFDWMPEGDLDLLAGHVLTLAFPGQDLPTAASIEPAPALATDAATLAAGEKLYLRHCAACHGIDGRGGEPPPDWVDNTSQAWPRDFTAGFLRGGGDVRALTWRVLAGMPGARMPPLVIADADAARLVAYVHQLIPEGVAEHHVQWRRHLLAVRAAALPADAAAWQAIEAVRLPTAPLRWRRDGVFEVELRAVHDGKRIAVQLQWHDASRDDRALDGSRVGDGAALQWTANTSAPLLAMGSAEDPVCLWHWRAFRSEDIAGALDLLQPDGASGVATPLPGLTCPARRGEVLTVGGAASVAPQRGGGRSFEVWAEWRQQRWTVVMTRELRRGPGGDVDLRAGDTVLLALAIWNGSTDLTPASKAISNWHELELQR